MFDETKIFQHPFTAMIAGPSSCGKTYFLLKILNNIQEFIFPVPKKIVYCFSEWQPSFDKFIHKIEFKKGLDEIDDLNNFQENLLIFDDLMNECQNDKDILHLFTRGSHHKNISTILLTQNLFNNGKYSRTMSLNCHYLIIFNNPRDKSQISYLSREMFPLNSKFLIEAYEDATSKPYGYILIDNTQICDENLRIKTNITGKNIIYIRK